MGDYGQRMNVWVYMKEGKLLQTKSECDWPLVGVIISG